MCCVKKGANHESAPIPEEGKWVVAKEIKDISGLTHGVGWCAPQQGACKLTLNVKDGIIQEALVEVIGYEFVHLGKFMDFVKKGIDPKEALEKAKGCYGRFAEAKKYIDPRHE